MAEEDAQSGRARGDASAALLAAALGKVSDNPRVDALIERQIALADLQIADLEREDQVRHWSLRVHHVSDVLKLGFELAAALVVTAIAAIIGGAMWTAAHDNGLVIEAFNVPADMAANGLSGEVVATKVQDRLAWMLAHTDSIREANSFRNNWGDDIKVQIPDTGVSIGELYRYLAAWLGHQTHITGEVWRAGGKVSLSIRTGGDPARTLTAPESRFDDLIAKGAEAVYAKTQPYRWAVFLDTESRSTEAIAAVRDLALSGPLEERPWGYTFWGLLTVSHGNDIWGNLEKQRTANRLAPDLPNVAYNLAAAEEAVNHDEAALHAMQRAHVLYQAPAARQLASYAVAIQILMSAQESDELLGDYVDSQAQMRAVAALPDYADVHSLVPFVISENLARMHDVSGSERAEQGRKDEEALVSFFDAGSDNPEFRPPGIARAFVRGDWAAARAGLLALKNSPQMRVPAAAVLGPWLSLQLAYADAGLGDLAAAHTLTDSLPVDCYDCLRVRGQIAAFEHRWDVANDLFAKAVNAAPSIPFAHLEWGQMLMAKGDLEGAIAKFEHAHQKSPHFADPLEMWGEALIAKNRSDLALAKFEEANKYAPNWRRLHQKWGEALMWSGNKDEAKKQFTLARNLAANKS